MAELDQRLNAGSFTPFRIIMQDGRVVDVKAKDMALLADDGRVYVYQPGPEEGTVAGYPDPLPVAQVRSIEPIPNRAA